MSNTRTRRRTARPLIVSGDVHLDATVAAWEVELMVPELTCGGTPPAGERDGGTNRRGRRAAG